MISRKDNLLVKPWQDKRYDNHRRKVQSARPAIDNRPPLPRQHVTLKLKKQQKEFERCAEIEKSNFNLLKRLNYVMRTNRVDNFWSTPQPNFLHRIAIYDTRLLKLEDLCLEEVIEEGPKDRKSRCSACKPQLHKPIEVPEERLPWEPEKRNISRFRSKSVPPRKTILPKPLQKSKLNLDESQSITLSRGCLKLSVNFPSDTLVKLKDGTQEKVLISNLCHCRNVAN